MKLNRTNLARRNVEAFALSVLLRERNRSGANGTHADRRTRRLKTRQSVKRNAKKDWE